MGGSVWAIQRGAPAAGRDIWRGGLIGCGSRGTGAAANAVNADPGARLVAMADAFGDRLEGSLKLLKERFPDQVDVDKSRCFVGFDAYKDLIASGVDVVLMAAPPHFRPLHLAAAIRPQAMFAENRWGLTRQARGASWPVVNCQEEDLCVVSGLCCA